MMMNDDNAAVAALPPTPSLWKQLGLLCRYYWPRLGSQILWYSVSSLLIAVLMILTSHYNLKLLYGLLTTILGGMMIFAPLVFARYNSRAVDISLPASWQAQSIFMIGYTVIVMPFMTLFLPSLGTILFPGEVNLRVMMLSMNLFDSGGIPPTIDMLLSTRLNMYMNGTVPALFTLFFVVLFKHSVVFKTLVWDIVIGAVVYLSIMIYSIVVMVGAMSEHFVNVEGEVPPEEIEAFSEDIVHQMMMPIITWSVIGYIVAAVVMIVLVTLKLKNRQI